MKDLFAVTLMTLFIGGLLHAQELPEYNNSAIAWNSKNNKSVPLAQEDGLRSQKVGAGQFVPMGGLFAKNKTVMKFEGEKSNARITADDTLRVFAKIDKDINPNGLFRVYKSVIRNGNREVLAMTTSAFKGAQRNDGDFPCTFKKISPGIFLVKVVGPKSGDELFFYVGTHENALAKLTLGID